MSIHLDTSAFKIVKNDGISFVSAVMILVGVFLEIALISTWSGREQQLLTYSALGLILLICLPFLVIISRIQLTRRILVNGKAVNAFVVEIEMFNVPRIHYVAYTMKYEIGGTVHKTIIRDGPPFSMPPLEVGDEIRPLVDQNKIRRALVPSRFMSKS